MRQAVILSGGFGTRLSHVVSDVPKPMAPIKDLPFLDYIITTLLPHEIAFCIVDKNQFDNFDDYFRKEGLM